jgi:hypothetical protein
MSIDIILEISGFFGEEVIPEAQCRPAVCVLWSPESQGGHPLPHDYLP